MDDWKLQTDTSGLLRYFIHAWEANWNTARLMPETWVVQNRWGKPACSLLHRVISLGTGKKCLAVTFSIKKGTLDWREGGAPVLSPGALEFSEPRLSVPVGWTEGLSI
jgi:hypothetical protein